MHVLHIRFSNILIAGSLHCFEYALELFVSTPVDAHTVSRLMQYRHNGLIRFSNILIAGSLHCFEYALERSMYDFYNK